MRKTRKRLATLFLAVCLLLSMAVPAVWAVEETRVISYSFGSTKPYLDITHSKQTVTDDFGKNYTVTAPNTRVVINDGVKYLNQSASNVDRAHDKTSTTYYYPNRAWTSGTTFAAGFYGQTDITDGQWIALQINNVTAGTYDMTFRTGAAGQGGIVTVYVLDGAKYSGVINAYNLNDSTVLSKEHNDAIYKALGDQGAILNDIEKSKLDCSNQATNNYQSIGNVTFANSEDNDDYVLLFRIVGKNAETGSTAYSLSIRELTLTPAVASIETADGTEYYTDAAKAVEAINAAESGTAQLLSDLTAESITLNPYVTLDLNGKTLNAASVNATAPGANVIDSTNGGGLLVVTSEITSSGNNGNYLPLMDTAANGYRLYEAKIEALGINSKSADGDSAKFWFNLHLTNSEAYTLIEKGNTGFGFAANMMWNETDSITAANADATFIGTWAEAVAKDAGKDVGLKVTGLSDVTGFTLTPVVSANGVTVSASALSLS